MINGSFSGDAVRLSVLMNLTNPEEQINPVFVRYRNGQTSISIGTATRMTRIDSGRPSRG